MSTVCQILLTVEIYNSVRIGVRFDPNIKSHINLACNRCAEIHDIDEPLLEEALERVESRMVFKMTEQRIVVYGFCRGLPEILKSYE